MVTLREFILGLNKSDHFRVYKPNRDCLVFVSFLSPHSEPGILKDLDYNNDAEWEAQWKYFGNRKYCQRKWRTSYDDLDDETKLLLDKHGDCQVIGVDASTCYVADYIESRISPTIDVIRPDADYVECLDIFIL